MPAHDGTMVSDRIRLVERFRDAYQTRDINRLMDLFAEDAELTWAVGTFRGKTAIRKVFEWDFGLSPAVTVRDVGVGAVISDHTIVYERVVEATAEGIPYQERVVTIYEINDAGLILRMRSYYDKLAIMHQVACGYPGLRGRLFRAMTGYLVRMGSKGLKVSPN